MLTGIDHIVIAVKNLDAASKEFEAAGFTVTPGGSHETGGTHNALIPFADGSYLELIAVQDAELAKDHPWFRKMAGEEGFVTFAVAADPIEYEVERVQSLGLTVPELRDGGRRRLDGQQLQWKSANVESDPPAPLPFLIQDVTARNLRVPGGDETVHANGVKGTTGITIVTGDAQQAMVPFGKMLSAPVAALDHGYEGVQEAWRFFLQQQWVDLIDAPPDDSPLAEYHRARGDAIYQIYLTVDAGPEFPAGRIDIGTLPDIHILTTN
jgi:hypothetical protein